ncbi:hypothetical protein DPEC_G00245500 [Dallia pectoralis]|uniref:Uncharacterized protein n=1 Tax=Dallia pectoralis TaxID=75939 RepID=A0ACC2FW10_DALPE|nr:hypothetical protein DPEC_G00245500 [Dallia pectoralis]
MQWKNLKRLEREKRQQRGKRWTTPTHTAHYPEGGEGKPGRCRHIPGLKTQRMTEGFGVFLTLFRCQGTRATETLLENGTRVWGGGDCSPAEPKAEAAKAK